MEVRVRYTLIVVSHRGHSAVVYLPYTRHAVRLLSASCNGVLCTLLQAVRAAAAQFQIHSMDNWPYQVRSRKAVLQFQTEGDSSQCTQLISKVWNKGGFMMRKSIHANSRAYHDAFIVAVRYVDSHGWYASRSAPRVAVVLCVPFTCFSM